MKQINGIFTNTGRSHTGKKFGKKFRKSALEWIPWNLIFKYFK
jgi:hypothetical protein